MSALIAGVVKWQRRANAIHHFVMAITSFEVLVVHAASVETNPLGRTRHDLDFGRQMDHALIPLSPPCFVCSWACVPARCDNGGKNGHAAGHHLPCRPVLVFWRRLGAAAHMGKIGDIGSRGCAGSSDPRSSAQLGRHRRFIRSPRRRGRAAGSGTVRPSALAVFDLMTSSTLVACWSGRSVGFSPLRIGARIDAHRQVTMFP